MNARRSVCFALCLLVLLSACGQAVATVEVSEHPRSRVVVETQAVIQGMPKPVSLPTQAPYPTSVPNRPIQPKYAPTAIRPQPYLPTMAAPGGNYFQNYGYNYYEVTAEDHLSTFGLDVDTASYTVARRYLDEGNLPPADAIRVEEFVNYFRGDYPAPVGETFAIYVDGSPSPFTYDGTYMLRIGIKGREVSEFARKPLTLTLVVDCSGSMSMGDRMALVKEALYLLNSRLGAQDMITIVGYSTDAWTVLEPVSANEKWRINAAIASLEPTSSTNVEAGLRLGYQWAMSTFRRDTVNRVILLSDGVANTGDTSADGILQFVRGYVSEGVNLTAIGVGMGNYNDVLLEQLANRGNGFYAYIDNMDEARRLFVDELTATLQTIALDARAQVDFNPEVVAWYRQIGYENRQIADQDFRNDAVDAGEIGAGHAVTVLYEVGFRPGAEGRIATVQLRWKDADSYQVREINTNLNLWELYPSFVEGSPYYQMHVLVAEYAEILRQSPYAYGFGLGDIQGYLPLMYERLLYDQAVREWFDLVSKTIEYSRSRWGW